MPYTIVINPIIVQSSLDVNGDDRIDLLDLTLVAQTSVKPIPKPTLTTMERLIS